jgi:hypothetical protein
MAAKWSSLCRAKDFAVDGDYVDVRFGDDRRHRVFVEEDGPEYRLTAFVVRQSVVGSTPDLPLMAWMRNRATALVGFRIDRRERLVGEAWVPKCGLSADEFQHYVRTVATECDRFEYTLTGKDIE